jgi:hypothetical protein
MKKLIIAVLILLISKVSFAQNSISNIPKCGRYNLHIENPCHWILASKTKWIIGYVLVTGVYLQYFDTNGNEIEQSKVIGYGRLQRRHSKTKCYKPINSTARS